MENNIKKIMLIKTDKGCFISDCYSSEGTYDWRYHHTDIEKYSFDGEKPLKTLYENWYKIKRYPTTIQEYVKQEPINERYELINKDLKSEKMPLIINYDDRINYDSNMIENMYKYNSDKQDDKLMDVELKIEEIFDVDNFIEAPTVEYDGIKTIDFSDKTYKITNKDIQHQMLDKIIFPSVLLHNSICKFTSKQMYDITRQYILNNINNKYAKISSNYDFCFEVKKLIPLIEPETVNYHQIFAKTKKERQKIHTSIKKYNEKSIFEMTHDQEKYKGYSIIPDMTADSEQELKDKVDTWLSDLILIINKPLETCPCCKGVGYIDEIEKANFYKENKNG